MLLLRFWKDFGDFRGSKIESPATRPAIMVPSALGKASGTDFGWILEVLGWFRDGFRGDFGWSWQFFLYRFSGKRKKTKFKTGLQDWTSRLEFKTDLNSTVTLQRTLGGASKGGVRGGVKPSPGTGE